MEIMTLLNFSELNALRSRFTKYPLGLDITQFVGAMLDILKDSSNLNKRDLTIRLCELFTQVDVNGNGLMEWEEFSSFCIETGMRLDRRDEMNKKFAEDNQHKDNVHHGGCIRKMRYFPDLKKLVTCEGGRKTIKIYDPFVVREGAQDSEPRLKMIHGMSIDVGNSADKAREHAQALDVEFLPEFSALAVSTSDMQISFWDVSVFMPSLYNREGGGVKFFGSLRASRTQYHLCWNAATKTLYTTGSGATIYAWSVECGPGLFVMKPAEPRGVLKKHTDMVTDMLAVPAYKLLISCGLDKKIVLWDTGNNKCKGERVGHKMGVRSIAYAGEGVVLSCGFEFDIYAWDISGMSFEPHFVLGP